MENLNKITHQSQGAFQIPVIVPVKDAIADLIFDCVNLNDFTTQDEAIWQTKSFLRQNLDIAYSKESAAGLELALQTLYLTLEDKLEKYQIINSISAIQYVVNKIKGVA